MDFGNLNIDDLAFGTAPGGLVFGPSDTQPDFGATFDGKLYKPYNKRDKLGKMVEFSMTQVAQPTQNSASQAQQNAMKQSGAQKQQVQTNANSQLVEAAEDFGFQSVEDKSKAKQEKKRGLATQTQAQKAKAKVQQVEDRAYLQANFQGPQQTKKKQQWAAQVARANHANNQ